MAQMLDRQFPEDRAESVSFDLETGLITVLLKDGGSLEFRAKEHPELAGLSDLLVATVTTDHIGFYLRWPAANIDLYVPALVLGLSGKI